MTRFPWKTSAMAVGLAVATIASAQYKYVGPDGRVTYSDQPPPPGSKVVDEKKLGRNGGATSTTPLPFALQQAVSKYPVTLYTGSQCGPCDEGRAYLRSRGVPFTEKTVTSNEDITAFKQQSPDGTAPVLTVGGRRALGYLQNQWTSLLDDAGYPKASSLPPDYQNPLPTPLSPTTQAPASSVGAASAPSAAPPPPQTTRGPRVPGASSADAPPPAPAPAPSAPGFRF